MSDPLIRPPGMSRVGASTSAAAALLLPSVGYYIKTCPEVIYEADVICSDLSYEGGMVSGLCINTISFGLEPDA